MSIPQSILKSSFIKEAAFYVDKLKYQSLFSWIVTSLVVLLGLRYFKDVMVFVLMKLYGFFIQQSTN